MGRTRRRRALLLDVLGGASLPAKIYGVSWNKGSSPTLTRTDDAVGMTAAAGVGLTPATNSFDTAEIYKDITEVTDGLGNVFVRIPKCYVKKTDGVNSKTWQVSKSPLSGGYLPWCFVGAGGAELPHVDVGKYNASLGAGNKLESKAGKAPLVNVNIVQVRGYAQANGAGYQQLDIHVVDLLQTLFYVEFATLNSQAIMAGFTVGAWSTSHVATAAESSTNRIIVANATAANFVAGQAISVGTSLGGNQIFYGRTLTSIDVVDASNKALNFDGTPVNIAVGNIVYNTGWVSGFSSGIAASSGSLISASSGKGACKYRGVENPWGSIWQWVDGLNINDYRAWVCKDAASYASNLFAAPYEQVGYLNHNADGYVTAMGWDANLPFVALPTAVGGNTTTYYSDYYYRNSGQRAAILGGAWGDGAAAGVACWYLSIASSHADVSIGGRLLKKAL